VRAWHHTCGLPAVITDCSNKYGPYHFPEKLIPRMIIHTLEGKPLPVYGKDLNVRDWLHVVDHADALLTVAQRGALGESYKISGHNAKMNIYVVKGICAISDELRTDASGPHERLIAPMTDHLGHHALYVIDAGKIGRELGWTPKATSIPTCASRWNGTSPMKSGGATSVPASIAASASARPEADG
jgi:dTDP-glucose 4,6-dehydratase